MSNAKTGFAMGKISSDDKLLSLLLEDHKAEKGLYEITPYWQTYNRRIVREVQKSGIGNLQSNHRLLKGFAEGGVPRVTIPDNALKRFVFELVPNLPIFKKIIGEHEKLIRVYYQRYLDLKIKNAKMRLQALEEKFGRIPFRFDVDAGEADDAFEWNGYQVTAKIVPYLERTYYFYSAIGDEKPKSILEIGSGLGLSTLSHIIINPELKHITNVDIPATLYLSTQFLKSFEEIDVQNYLEFKNNGNAARDVKAGKIQCLCIPPWSIEHITHEHDWFHNAYSFMEMEPDVIKNYLDVSSRFIQKGFWIMSLISGHKPGAGQQKETVTLDIIESRMPQGFEKIPLAESDLEEMSDKVQDTLIYKKR